MPSFTAKGYLSCFVLLRDMVWYDIYDIYGMIKV